MITTINCNYRCELGQAPTVSTVDMMYATLESYAERRGLVNYIAERQYFDNIAGTDDMIFGIFRDYKS